MSQRSVVVLLVALVVLALGVFVAQRDRSPAAASSGAPIVSGLQAALNDVERVTVAKAGAETVATLERRDDTWVIAEKGGYPADVAKLRQGLRALAEAKVLETKTANSEFYDKLGVEDVAAAGAGGVAVTIATAGNELGSLILGNAVGSKQRYARRSNEPQSYLLDRNPDFPKSTSQWLDADIVDVRGERVQQVTIKHPDGETVAISKAELPPSDLTQGTVVNFAVAAIPAGRELLYPGVANVIGSSLRELKLEDVERADGAPLERPVQVEFKTFDGLVVRMTGASRGEEDWATFEASVDAEQAARFAAPAAAQPDTAPPPAEGAEPTPAAPAAAADATAARPDPAAEAARINARVAGWRYKIAGFQYDQMTRRMADLLKPVG